MQRVNCQLGQHARDLNQDSILHEPSHLTVLSNELKGHVGFSNWCQFRTGSSIAWKTRLFPSPCPVKLVSVFRPFVDGW